MLSFLLKCQILNVQITLFKFESIWKILGVPIADEKTEGPVTSMNYCGLTINNESMCVKIPEKTIKELFKKLNECEFKKK